MVYICGLTWCKKEWNDDHYFGSLYNVILICEFLSGFLPDHIIMNKIMYGFWISVAYLFAKTVPFIGQGLRLLLIDFSSKKCQRQGGLSGCSWTSRACSSKKISFILNIVKGRSNWLSASLLKTLSLPSPALINSLTKLKIYMYDCYCKWPGSMVSLHAGERFPATNISRKPGKICISCKKSFTVHTIKWTFSITEVVSFSMLLLYVKVFKVHMHPSGPFQDNDYKLQFERIIPKAMYSDF